MNASRGYIAVVSALILSSILSLAVFTSSADVFLARFSQLDAENKLRSKALAYTCAYEALYAYAEDSSYSPKHQIINVGQTENEIPETCTVDAITTSGTTLTIFVHASMLSAYTALEIQATTNPLAIISWHEITSIPP